MHENFDAWTRGLKVKGFLSNARRDIKHLPQIIHNGNVLPTHKQKDKNHLLWV